MTPKLALRFLDQVISMIKEKSDNSDHCPQTGPNQFEPGQIVPS